MDDEAPLADLLKKYLERLGYEVDITNAAEPALEMFEARPARYDLVLADLTLPGMDGEEMLLKMLDRRPTLGAILASGYPHHPRSKAIQFLQKPFVPKMLADLISETLRRVQLT